MLRNNMHITALVGSPRRAGNTDLLLDRIFKGAESRGHTWKKIHLYDYHISPCLDCRGCKKGSFDCRLEDGMIEIYPRLEDADVIIFGTPVYWYGPTAKMKLLIDRLRPYIASRRLRGKRGILVSPSEEGPSCCGPLVEMFRMSLLYLGMEMAGCLLAKAYERGEIGSQPEELRRAWELGASI